MVSRNLIILLLCAMLPAIAAAANRDATVYYHGNISDENNRQFFTRIKGKTVNRLVITSSGGDVATGIALGSWVFDNRIDVEIPEYCLSSCANYVFPAARHKRIHKGAVVAWHGNYHHLKHTGKWRDDIAPRMSRTGEDEVTAEQWVFTQVEQLVVMEREFFQHIGVDNYLCWIGKMPPYNVLNYYFLSKTDMARFGVMHVETPSRYAQTDVSGFVDHIRYINLKHEDISVERVP